MVKADGHTQGFCREGIEGGGLTGLGKLQALLSTSREGASGSIPSTSKLSSTGGGVWPIAPKFHIPGQLCLTNNTPHTQPSLASTSSKLDRKATARVGLSWIYLELSEVTCTALQQPSQDRSARKAQGSHRTERKAKAKAGEGLSQPSAPTWGTRLLALVPQPPGGTLLPSRLPFRHWAPARTDYRQHQPAQQIL